jgi:copper chaperone CopZ
MERRTFKVPNMTCSGCVNTVRSQLERLNGVEVLEISRASQLVTVQWAAPASWDGIERALVEIEYTPTEA